MFSVLADFSSMGAHSSKLTHTHTRSVLLWRDAVFQSSIGINPFVFLIQIFDDNLERDFISIEHFPFGIMHPRSFQHDYFPVGYINLLHCTQFFMEY